MGEHSIHQFLQQLGLNDLLWVFDAVSLYPSAMSDDKSIYSRVEPGYAFTPDMNNDLVRNINNQTFTQGSEFLKIKFCNPKILIAQHLPINGKVNKTEINRMRDGYIVDTLTSVDIQETLKIGGKVEEIYEGVMY